MKKKGFTLVELLVVIAIIALLMGILMPALARVRQIAYRLYCGTNLSGLGKAMLIYCQDYDDEFPHAGLNTATWACGISNWSAATSALAYGNTPPGSASISSCFYLLVKYSEVTPKSFVCKGDSGVADFKAVDMAPAGMELVDLWNFSANGIQFCSYSYHTPFVDTSAVGFPLTTQSGPGMAVAADPNPWLKSAEALARTTAEWTAFLPTSDRDSIKLGNAKTHQDDGQNVLFVDGHASFEKESFCGVDEDNIYTRWTSNDPTTAERRKGLSTILAANTTDASFIPKSKNDSLLLTDNGIPTGR
jgi:prepilin-type N-terminal cleavage/methylation domain-containing protein/prepilin-type processing-associated H-X9-DG protein